MGTKALLVGINAYADAPLKGCVNDVWSMHNLLTTMYNVDKAHIRMLLDEQAVTPAIEAGLRWLAAPDEEDGGTPRRIFHFAGHGTFIADRNGDEPDGRDECLVPYDYASKGPMTDDLLRQLYATFAPDTHLLLVMDCCHSGTIQRVIAEDVRFRFLPVSREEEKRIQAAAEQVREQRRDYVLEQVADLRDRAASQDEWEQRIFAAMASFDKKHFGQDNVAGNIVLISACRADQTAADARFGNSYNGALTYYLTDVLRQKRGQVSYRELIEAVGDALNASNFLQEPQLECSTDHQKMAFWRC